MPNSITIIIVIKVIVDHKKDVLTFHVLKQQTWIRNLLNTEFPYGDDHLDDYEMIMVYTDV